MAHIYIKGKQPNAQTFTDGMGNYWEIGSVLRDESARMSWDDVRNLCIAKGLYTRGDSEAYTMLQQLVNYWDDNEKDITTQMLQLVAEDILDHSVTEYNLEALMFELQRSCVRRFYTA